LVVPNQQAWPAETVAASPWPCLRLANLNSEIAERLSPIKKSALMWVGRPGAELRNEANVRRQIGLVS
jgi:hypothetical protein